MNNFTDIPWVFRIADFLQPKEIVTALELVLYLGIIGPDTFRPMAELKVFPCPWVGQAEQNRLCLFLHTGEVNHPVSRMACANTIFGYCILFCIISA